jgi:deoxyribodipyrimidine photo-lyase
MNVTEQQDRKEGHQEKPVIVHWFRQDLRLADNPALSAAAATGRVLPVYILDDAGAGASAMGAASRWWLHRSLKSLSSSLQGKLVVYSGNPAEILGRLAEQHGANSVFWNRCYEPWRLEQDRMIEARLSGLGFDVKTFNGSLLWEPESVVKKDGTPYRVFSPYYYRGCKSALAPRQPIPAPQTLDMISAGGMSLEQLTLLPRIRWYESMEPHWQPGEAGALKRVRTFLDEGILNYKEGRNFPAAKNVSRLSPHLHFGEVSPNQVWHAAKGRHEGTSLEHFLSELGWREFSHNLLFFNPDLPRRNLQPKFDAFPWLDDPVALSKWQRGMTGYPIVDAGMRELWQTGYMHNRVRMIVGSFLVKNLLLNWHHGEKWFWDTLVDADLANNSASWQWIAGCGADAAPYFRIFNPVTQGKKFDPDGAYTRRFVPELQALPDRHLFAPWEAPSAVLAEAGVRLGETYPEPVVDLKQSRERALQAFQSLKSPVPQQLSGRATGQGGRQGEAAARLHGMPS